MSNFSMIGLLAVISGMCAVSFLYFGIYIADAVKNSRRYRNLLYACFLSSLWCIIYIVYYLSGDPFIKNICQRFVYTGMLTFVILLQFFIKYMGILQNKKAALILSVVIWISPLVFVSQSIFNNAVTKDFPGGFWFLYMEIQTTLYNLITFVLLCLFYKKARTNKSKRQALILSGSGIVLIVFSWVADYYFGFLQYENIKPFWLLIWMGILSYTIKKYRFIAFTPEIISRDITENIEEGIVLLDPDFNFVFGNNALQNLFKIGKNDMIQVQDFIAEKDMLRNKLSAMSQTSEVSAKMRVNIVPKDSEDKFLADITMKKIMDAYNDISGYLIILKRIKDIGFLRSRYKISPREMEMIRQLETGKTNKEIADFLGLTIRTVETHIAHIYNKLGINSRVELLNFLSGFLLEGKIC